ncbi:MAG: competence/damage-inducible protein A [Gammaproteobacteria bacterium]|nr:competence/damage-inducible protein A [Gammaproteobacteria bacterium]
MTTACVLIIGNEILSGKTQDTNLQFLGSELAKRGVSLKEARVLVDEKNDIVKTLNECRTRYDYVITTGGIGPTHDDITSECVAAAFGRELVLNDEAVACLTQRSRELNEARLKMAHIPKGAELIDNPVSNAPGFRLDNVFVLAGIPSVAQGMFATFADSLETGETIISKSLDVYIPEGDLAAPLGDIAQRYPTVEIGSYPFSRDGRYGANLVVRAMSSSTVDKVLEEIESAMQLLEDS